MPDINKSNFCVECTYQGYQFEISPKYIAAIAELRSAISTAASGLGIGPYRLLQAEWDAYITQAAPQLDLRSDDINNWRLQVVVFAGLAKEAHSSLTNLLGEMPTAVELYLGQLFGTDLVGQILASPDRAIATIAGDVKAAEIGARFPGLIAGTCQQTIDDIDASLDRALAIVIPFVEQAEVDLLADAHNSVGADFESRAPVLMHQLIIDFHLKDFQAAGVIGNGGYESAGFTTLQEIKPVSGRGGLGYFQWTGARRVAFETWCSENGLSTADEDANYGFLCVELRGAYRSSLSILGASTDLEDATVKFEKSYERAGIKNYPQRVAWARKALTAFQNGNF
ncbi:hypothetical protein ACVITL_005751 [Rhizobium pisi]